MGKREKKEVKYNYSEIANTGSIDFILDEAEVQGEHRQLVEKYLKDCCSSGFCTVGSLVSLAVTFEEGVIIGRSLPPITDDTKRGSGLIKV